MKKSGNILPAIPGFAFIICIPAAFIFGYLNNLDYQKNGTAVECEVYAYETLGRGKLVYPAKFRYTDEFGNEHIDTHVFEMRLPELGDKYNVIYARKSNGKYTAGIDK